MTPQTSDHEWAQVLGSTDRLIFEKLDIRHTHELTSLTDPKVKIHLGSDFPKDLAELEIQLRELTEASQKEGTEHRFVNIAVRISPSKQCIGRLEAFLKGAEAEIAYLFIPQSWGKGYASEACNWLVDYLEHCGINTVWACITPTNNRSIALCTRLGFAPTDTYQRERLASYDAGDLVFSLNIHKR